MINFSKTLLLFISCLLTWHASGQTAEHLTPQILALHQALISRDSTALDLLLNSKLTYGHSNGWIEDKKELIYNNCSQKLIYTSIQEDSINIVYTGNTAIARFNARILGLMDSKRFHLKLGVCQTWVHSDNSWSLLARQAVKLENLD